MKIQYSTFIMPHIGDKYSQCADRFAIGKHSHCFAIADGVGNSFFPEVWAEIVSNDYTEHSDIFIDDNTLVREAKLIEKWKDLVNDKISNLSDTEKFLVEMSKDRCGFAACTFVGLSIDNKQWHSQALGDSYLFVLDKEYNILQSVASQRGHEFDNFPEYFASSHGKNNGTIITESGNLTNVAYFVLLTDAISDWFIKSDAEKRKALVNVVDMQTFHTLIQTEREKGDMKDDDTTAVILKVLHDDNEKISIEELYNTDINQLIRDEERIAKEENDKLAKEAEEKTNEQETQIAPQTDEPKIDDVPLTIVEPKPVEIITDEPSDNNLSEDKEALLAQKLSEFMNTAQDRISSIVDDIDFSHGQNKKVWKSINNSLNDMRKIVKEINKKLSQIKH